MAIYRFFKYINPKNASTSIYLYMSVSLYIFIYLYILYYIYIIYYICIIYIQLYICICIYIYIYLYIIGKKYSTSIPNSFHIMVDRGGGRVEHHLKNHLPSLVWNHQLSLNGTHSIKVFRNQ